MLTPPFPVLGMRKRARAHGEPFLAAVVDRELVLPAGAELHLRRLHAGNLSSPEFALQVIPPQRVVTDKALKDAAADRLDGVGIRRDPRDANPDPEAMP